MDELMPAFLEDFIDRHAKHPATVTLIVQAVALVALACLAAYAFRGAYIILWALGGAP